MLKTYAYHKPSEAGLETVKNIRNAFSTLHKKLLKVVPEGRERDVALEHLETTAMWAIKGVVLNDPESTTPEM